MEKLPQGLVSTTGHVPSRLGDADRVHLDDIERLWRVFNANPSVHRGDVGPRLENFCWRIWSSERLLRSLNGSDLARLFLRISESRPFEVEVSVFQKTRDIYPHQEKEKETKDEDDIKKKPRQRSAPTTASGRTHHLTPILKKHTGSHSHSSHGDLQKKTRLLITGTEGQSITRQPSMPPTPTPVPVPVPNAQPLAVEPHPHPRSHPHHPPSSKKTHVAVKAKNAKRRPVIMRRKSSQMSTGSNTHARPHSPVRAPSPVKVLTPLAVETAARLSELEVDDIDAPLKPTTARIDASDLAKRPPQSPEESFLSDLKGILKNNSLPSPSPSPKSGSKAGFISARDDYKRFDARFFKPESYEQPSAASLVEKDFRTRFVERRQNELVSSLGGIQVTAVNGADPLATTAKVDDDGGISVATAGTETGQGHGIPIPAKEKMPVVGVSVGSTGRMSELSSLIEKSRMEAHSNEMTSAF